MKKWILALLLILGKSYAEGSIAKLHASGKSMILAVPCQNLLADSTGGGEGILEKVEEPPPGQGTPKGRFYAAKSFAIDPNLTSPPPNLPVIVETNFYLDDLIYIEDKSELFTAYVTFTFKWRDPRLAFASETELPNVFTELAVIEKLREIWWPQIEFFNADDPPAYDNRALFIFPDGTVRYVISVTGNFRAKFNFMSFPFDTQKLNIEINSFLWDKEHVQFISSPDQEFYIPKEMSIHKEAKVLNISENIRFDYFGPNLIFTTPKYPEYSVYEIAIIIKRNFGYYLYQVFLPLLIVLGISFVVFFDFTSGLLGKAAFTLTAFLVFVAAKFSINQDLPRIEYMTAIDRVFVLSYICFGVTVILLVLEKLWRERHAQRAKVANYHARWIIPLVFIIAFSWIIVNAIASSSP